MTLPRHIQSTCHGIDSSWTCLGCERVHCVLCDGVPSESELCWSCLNAEPDDAA